MTTTNPPGVAKCSWQPPHEDFSIFEYGTFGDISFWIRLKNSPYFVPDPMGGPTGWQRLYAARRDTAAFWNIKAPELAPGQKAFIPSSAGTLSPWEELSDRNSTTDLVAVTPPGDGTRDGLSTYSWKTDLSDDESDDGSDNEPNDESDNGSDVTEDQIRSRVNPSDVPFPPEDSGDLKRLDWDDTSDSEDDWSKSDSTYLDMAARSPLTESEYPTRPNAVEMEEEWQEVQKAMNGQAWNDRLYYEPLTLPQIQPGSYASLHAMTLATTSFLDTYRNEFSDIYITIKGVNEKNQIIPVDGKSPELDLGKHRVIVSLQQYCSAGQWMVLMHFLMSGTVIIWDKSFSPAGNHITVADACCLAFYRQWLEEKRPPHGIAPSYLPIVLGRERSMTQDKPRLDPSDGAWCLRKLEELLYMWNELNYLNSCERCCSLLRYFGSRTNNHVDVEETDIKRFNYHAASQFVGWKAV